MSNTTPRSPSRTRYTNTAQALHWVVAALMFAALPLAWAAVDLPEGGSSSEFFFLLHKSVGLTILALTALRLAWRARHPAPSLPLHMAGWEQASARLSHWLLYVILLGMPLSGYIVSSAGGHPITYFRLFTLPAIFPKEEAWEKAGLFIHVVTGQWLVYALILLHLAATAWHVVLRRDGVLDRMLPPQDDITREEPVSGTNKIAGGRGRPGLTF